MRSVTICDCDLPCSFAFMTYCITCVSVIDDCAETARGMINMKIK